MQNYLVKTPLRGLRRRVGDPSRPIDEGAVIRLHPLEVESLVANGALEETGDDITVDVVSAFPDALPTGDGTLYHPSGSTANTTVFRPSRDAVIAAVAELGGLAVFKDQNYTSEQWAVVFGDLPTLSLLEEIKSRFYAGDPSLDEFFVSVGGRSASIAPLAGLADASPPIDYQDGVSIAGLKHEGDAQSTAIIDSVSADGQTSSGQVQQAVPTASPPAVDVAPAKARNKPKAPPK